METCPTGVLRDRLAVLRPIKAQLARTDALIDHWRAGRFTLIVTDEVVGEYLAVLRRPKFGLPNDVIDDISPRELLNRLASDESASESGR